MKTYQRIDRDKLFGFTFVALVLSGFVIAEMDNWFFGRLPNNFCDTTTVFNPLMIGTNDLLVIEERKKCKDVYAKCDGDEVCVELYLFGKYTHHISRVMKDEEALKRFSIGGTKN
jgi:hypothetical protein